VSLARYKPLFSRVLLSSISSRSRSPRTQWSQPRGTLPFRRVTALDPFPHQQHVAERHTLITTAAGDTVAPYDVGARDGSASDACAGKSNVPIVS
jgi:hypothetical protein